MELAALAARPAAAVLVLLWSTAVVPRLAAVGVAVAASAFATPFALASWPGGAWAPALPDVIVELARGGLLGLGAAAPVWAAQTAGRWAGERFRVSAAPSPVTALYAAMLGVAFVAVDGPSLLCAALAASYRAAPLAQPLAGVAQALLIGDWLATAVQLALPIGLAVAVAELAIAAASRVSNAVAAAWPSAALAPAVVLLLVAPLLPLLLAALALALRRGWTP